MQPGRELDALVAEKIMGQSKAVAVWRDHSALLSEVKPGEISMAMLKAYKLELQWSILGGCDFFPNYSTNIRDAWDVVEKMDDIIIERDETIDGIQWNVVIDGLETWASTAPHAICLAALRAHNIKF